MFTRYLRLTKALVLSFFRDLQSLFFSLVMPLMFLVIFGFMYADMGDNARITQAAVYVNASETVFWQALEGIPGFKVLEVETQAQVEDMVRLQQVPVGLTWDGTELVLYTNPVNIQDNTYYNQLAQGVKTSLDQERMGVVEFVSLKRNAVGGDGGFGLPFIFPGIIALGVVSSGLFAITSSFMHYKDKKVLKRLVATPMSRLGFLAALMTTRGLVSIISALLVLAAGILVFGIQLDVDWLLFIPYLLLSTLMMMGFGALITLISKTAENATQIASILMTAMLFFSGIYFPVEFLPSYFQRASTFLPLTYVARGLRSIMGIEALNHGRLFWETALLVSVSLVLIWLTTLYSDWSEG